MPTLGLIFIIAYAVSLFWGRRGILAVLACAIPFNDSSAISLGDSTVSPFYLGLLLYISVSVFAPSLRDDGAPRSKRGVLLALLLLGVVNAAFAPMLFNGIGVVAPGLGLDEQVGALTPLAFSLSSIAQLVYLTLNVGLVFYNERDRLLTQRHLAVGVGLGIAVGLWAYAGWQFDVPFPQTFFDNNPRGTYVVNPARLRAQFSEASHLGGFALAAVAFFTVRVFQATSLRSVALSFITATASGLLLISTASGTATVGALVALLAMALMGIATLVARGPRSTRLRPLVFLGVLAAVMVAAVAVDPAVEAITEVIQGKQGGASLETRSYVDTNAVALTLETWGFGVGLGNNRSSSMVLMLLSTVGVVGTIVFGLIVFRAIRNGFLDATRRAPALTLIAFVSAASVSLADFVAPLMWVAIAICYAPGIGPDAQQPQAQRLRRISPIIPGGSTPHPTLSQPDLKTDLGWVRTAPDFSPAHRTGT